MRKNLTSLASIAMGIFAASAAAPNWGVADTLEHYEIGPGIEYIKIRYESVPLTLWATTIDMTNPYNVVEQIQSNNSVPDLSRELVQDMSKRLTYPGHKVCAAFNHDFFSYDAGVSIGLNASNGLITWSSGSGRSTFAITQDKTASVFFPVPQCTASLSTGETVTIDQFNWGVNLCNGDCVLFTNLNTLTLDAEGRYIKLRPLGEWIINGEPTECEVIEDSNSPLQTSDTEFVLFLRNSKLNALPQMAAGSKIEISQKLVPGKFGTPPENILQAFHGYPSIAFEGKLHDGEYNDFENGREYELSCRTMAGMSEDGKTVYFVATELSANSVGINCIDIANWMLAHGAWNVVNFDSGGSTAVVVDHTMLNLPGRGSLRPVMDGVLVVSTAPEDNTIAHYTFSKMQLNVPIISLAPLTLHAQNQYKDVIERNVGEGFSFRCEPAELGWVDDEAVFHAGETVMSGKIIAEKDGIVAELPVSTRPVEGIHIAADEVLIDSVRPYRINLEGNINGQAYTLDPAAFDWELSNPACCRIENGILKGIENGETTITGTLNDISVELHVTVEVTPATLVHEDFADLTDYPLSSTVNNNILSIVHEDLPTGWANGAVLKFDQKAGRNPYVQLDKSYRLYSLPDSISLQIDLSTEAMEAIKHIRFDFTNKNGKNYWQPEYVPAQTGDQTIVWAFAEEGSEYPIEDFPLTLNAIRFVLNAGSRSEISIPLRELKAYYPVQENSAIQTPCAEEKFAWISTEGEQQTLHYRLQKTDAADIAIWTIDGQQIAAYTTNRELPGTYAYNIPSRFLSPGVYLLTIRTNGKNQSLKFSVK